MPSIIAVTKRERRQATDQSSSFTYYLAGYDFNLEHVDSRRTEKQISIHASVRVLLIFQIVIWTLAVSIFYVFPTCLLNTAVLKL